MCNTFVRSLDLDGLEAKYADIYINIDNDRANSFWEKNLPNSVNKPNSKDTSNRELRNFIESKYVDRLWVDESRDDPVK